MTVPGLNSSHDKPLKIGLTPRKAAPVQPLGILENESATKEPVDEILETDFLRVPTLPRGRDP